MHPKQDDTRAPLAELPWLALTLVAHAIRLGRASNGYAAHAWRAEPIALSRLLSAALRHVAAFLRGEDTDQKTGAHHLACAGFNVLAALELHQTAAQVDDRWRAPKAPAPEAPAPKAPAPPPFIEGASAGFAYDFSPTEMEGVRALRSDDAQGAATHELNAALDKRRAAVAADLAGAPK